MLTEKDFLQRIFEGVPLPSAAGPVASAMVEGFAGFDDEPEEATAPDAGAARGEDFARRLMESADFGAAETLPRGEVILGTDPAVRSLPDRVYYWPKAGGRPYQTLLFELPQGGLGLLNDTLFREEKKQRQLEDALHRLIQYVLVGFEKGGEGRTAEVRRGAQAETLVVISVRDDREGGGRQLVCFGTKCVATDALEVFTLREEARDWDRPLAEEHLRQLFLRHFKKLGEGEKWQDAFISGAERKHAAKLVKACEPLFPVPAEVEEAVRALIDEIAGSFGVKKKAYAGGKQRLPTYALPDDHGIGVAPAAALKAGFKNELKGFRVFDADERLLGYIVYVLDRRADVAKIRRQILEHNHFHNVLVVYPEQPGVTLELWQGNTPLRGRLTGAARQSRFDGEGGIVQLLSRFIVVSKSPIATPKDLAVELAWRAWHLRELAAQQLKDEASRPNQPLRALHATFNKALATLDERGFADAYAQTITYGLLAARWLSKDHKKRFTRQGVADLLPSTSPFLHDLFEKLVKEKFDANLDWLLDDLASLLSRTMVREVFAGERDPSIHFYQDFLDAYDPQIRKDRGVYYTPDEVVSYIVRTAHAALQDPERFDLPLGLADTTTWGEFAKKRDIAVPDGVDPSEPFVQVLDPATGTGTFVLRVIEVIHETMRAEYTRLGYGEKKAKAEWVKYVRAHLLPRVNAFELMMAPYIVCHLRLGLALEQTGFEFGEGDRLRVFLTNALELHTDAKLLGIGESAADEAREAEAVKTRRPISVVVGNPPYDKVARGAGNDANLWILSGRVPGRAGAKSLFDDVLDVARANTIFSHHSALYNLYVYFWRWAFWKVLEQQGGRPGVVAMITASSWLTGPGFVGLRQMARARGDRIWTVDLGGDNKSANLEPNIFEIESPVSITVVARGVSATGAERAAVYRKVNGATKQEKLAVVQGFVARPLAGDWTRVTDESMKPLVPATGGREWEEMPGLADLFPWQQPGCMWNRLWPIAPHGEMLVRRWNRFVASTADERPALFVTPPTGRNILTAVGGLPKLSTLVADAPHLPMVRYAWRSFDRHWVFDDPRLSALDRPSLWGCLSGRQVYLCAPMTKMVSEGPCMTVSTWVPDKDVFRGSFGGKDILPLYRDPEARQPNVTAGLLAQLAGALGISEPPPEHLAAYVHAVLSAPRYQQRFAEALRTPGPRVPLTRSAALWREAVALGEQLLWLHTYAERFRDPSGGRGESVPAVPGLGWSYPVTQMPETASQVGYDEPTRTLKVGNGLIVGVRPEVWAFEVSGMSVVKKWLGYRTRRGAGRAASSSNPLDRIRMESWPQVWSDELLDLLRVLTLTVELHPTQAALLDRICDGPLIPASDLPEPTDAERKEPKFDRTRNPRLT